MIKLTLISNLPTIRCMNVSQSSVYATRKEMQGRFRFCFRRWLLLKQQAAKAIDMSYFVGLSKPDFVTYIERHFTDKQNWDNHGTVWEIDHIVPLSIFDPFSTEDMKLAWHYLNLRPLNKRSNRFKSDALWDALMSIEKRMNVLPESDTLYRLRDLVMSKIVTHDNTNLDFLRETNDKNIEYIRSEGFEKRKNSCKNLIVNS